MNDIFVEIYIIRSEGQDFTAPETGIEHHQDGQAEAVRDGEDKRHFRIRQDTVRTGRSGGRLGRFTLERIPEAELVFDGRIKEILIQHMRPVNGGGRITGEVLPDRGGIIHRDLREQQMTDIREKRFQLLRIIVIAFYRDAAFMDRQPFQSIITDGQFLAEELAGFFFFNIFVPEVVCFL